VQRANTSVVGLLAQASSILQDFISIPKVNRMKASAVVLALLATIQPAIGGVVGERSNPPSICRTQHTATVSPVHDILMATGS
jgi:hypothetical protein